MNQRLHTISQFFDKKKLPLKIFQYKFKKYNNKKEIRKGNLQITKLLINNADLLKKDSKFDNQHH